MARLSNIGDSERAINERAKKRQKLMDLLDKERISAARVEEEEELPDAESGVFEYLLKHAEMLTHREVRDPENAAAVLEAAVCLEVGVEGLKDKMGA